MTVATAFAVSWNPLTNSNPSATRSAAPRPIYGMLETGAESARSAARRETTNPMPMTMTTKNASMPRRPGLLSSFFATSDGAGAADVVMK